MMRRVAESVIARRDKSPSARFAEMRALALAWNA